MKIFTYLIALVLLFTSQAVKAQSSGTGVMEAYCGAVMFFAVGESTGAAKTKYQEIGKAFLTAGVAIAGEKDFIETYNISKKIVEGSSDADFKSAVESCVTLAPK
jgi:hypothetical protein